MKTLFTGIFCGLLLSGFAAANAGPEQRFHGLWAFYMKIYQGREIPEGPLDTLRLRFEFLPDGQSHLFWWHQGENDHCARRGKFSVEEDVLIDQVVWVDPNNTYGCSQDPDMQLGRTTRTRFYFRGEDLVLRLPFGDEELHYVWRKTQREE